MHDNVMKMGDIVRNAREAKKLTQAALAELVDVTERTIIAIEQDQRNPTYAVLYRLVHTLDISADQIFYPDNVPLPVEQDQFIREFMACDENEKQIVTTTLRSLIRALHHDDPEKQD